MKQLDFKIKILVVEDEVLLAQDIALRLNKANYEVIGIAESANQAIALLIKTADVHIILIDIMIKGDKDGIELAQLINESFSIPFIFLTSHADLKVVERAKRVNPSAYLLKPFNDRQISIAIELALTNFSKQSRGHEELKEIQFTEKDNAVLKIKDSLFLKKNHHFERVPIDEILFLEADNNYSTIYTNNDKFLYALPLKKLEQQLPSDKFLRVHRSYIVNISAVQGFEGNILFLKTKKIPVSKSNHDSVFKLFKTI